MYNKNTPAYLMTFMNKDEISIFKKDNFCGFLYCNCNLNCNCFESWIQWNHIKLLLQIIVSIFVGSSNSNSFLLYHESKY